MNISRRLDALRGLDLADLDFRRMGGWPVWVRATCAVLLFLVALAGGYALALNGMVGELERLKEAQQALLREQAEKTSLAALLETLRAQHRAAEADLADLRLLLPAGAGEPSLLRNIGQAAEQNGLRIDGLELAPPQNREFYAELPFELRASGGYHQLGAFLGALAGLPRLVTLHDFDLRPQREGGGLRLQISAKTYFFLGEDE